MHPAAIQLAKDIHEEYLKEKGYRLVANTMRYKFSGGCVINRLRGCSKYNRDDAARWRFQIDSRILFDDLEYDPQTWPVTWMFGSGPHGRCAGGVYHIEDTDKAMPKRIAEDICRLTDSLLEERDAIRAAFENRIKIKNEGSDPRLIHTPKPLSDSERARLPSWLVEHMDRKFAKRTKKKK
jgi:hypothetical protein